MRERLVIAKSSDARLVLDSSMTTGLTRGLRFAAIASAVAVVVAVIAYCVGAAAHSARVGEVVAFLIVGVMHSGIPFAAFAASSFCRVEVESGVGIRKYVVNRLAGPKVSLHIRWSDLKHLAVERVLVGHTEDGNTWYSLCLSAVTEQGRWPLGQFDGGVGVWEIEERVALLRRYLGERLSLGADLNGYPAETGVAPDPTV